MYDQRLLTDKRTACLLHVRMSSFKSLREAFGASFFEGSEF